jgi:hypothetical protein
VIPLIVAEVVRREFLSIKRWTTSKILAAQARKLLDARGALVTTLFVKFETVGNGVDRRVCWEHDGERRGIFDGLTGALALI